MSSPQQPPTPRQVIVARHGETELNRLGVVQGSGIDPALNELGVAQAGALHAAFAGHFDLVVSSGMVRARQTAAPFRDDPGVRYVEIPELREICWGEYEGMKATPRMRGDYAALMAAWEAGDYDARHRGGESARQLADRLREGWRLLEAESFRKALVVTHGRALRCLMSILEAVPLSKMNDYGHANAGYYDVAEVSGGWQVRKHNAVDHLAHLTAATTSS